MNEYNTIKKFVFVHIPRNGGTSITKALRPFGNEFSFSNHMSALEIIQKIGDVEYQSLFSFAIVRNPWDRQVSFYHYILRDKTHHLHQRVKACGNFKEYIKRVLHPKDTRVSRLQKNFVYDSRGFCQVNCIGKFEKLEGWFERICLEMGLGVLFLPKLNVSVHKPYQDYYDKETRKIVEEIFEPDISIFGYSFV